MSGPANTGITTRMGSKTKKKMRYSIVGNTYCKSGKPSESLATSSLKAHLVSGRKVHGGSEKYGEVGSLLGSQLNTVGIEKKPTVHIIYPLVIKHGLLENPQ